MNTTLPNDETESEFRGKPLGFLSDGTPLYPICGADPGGYATQGDILTALSDGTPLNQVWSEFQTTLSIVNEQRDVIARHLSFGVTRAQDGVIQAAETEGFQQASEFGEPTSVLVRPELIKMGYDFRDFDLRIAMTWKYLRGATAAEIESHHRNALASDNRLVNTNILKALLNNVAGLNDEGNTVYPLYNGDSMVPPTSGFNTFTAPHTHYLTSATLDGQDLDDMVVHIEHHGYLDRPGTQLLLFVNPTEVPTIRAIRAGTNGADNDFIPSTSAPAYLTDQIIVGNRPPGEFNGLRIIGSYGDVWIAPTQFLPPGYLIMVASGGPNDPYNPVGFRELPDASQQGIRLLPGNVQKYPLIDSYYSRAFGTGVRHRGAAVVLQLTAGAYTVPASLTSLLVGGGVR